MKMENLEKVLEKVKKGLTVKAKSRTLEASKKPNNSSNKSKVQRRKVRKTKAHKKEKEVKPK